MRQTKPLYRYEQDLQYQRHKQRLKIINSRVNERQSEHSLDQMHKIWQKSQDDRKSKNKIIEN